MLSLTSDGAGLTGTLGAGRDRSSPSPVHSGRAAHSGPGGEARRWRKDSAFHSGAGTTGSPPLPPTPERRLLPRMKQDEKPLHQQLPTGV